MRRNSCTISRGGYSFYRSAFFFVCDRPFYFAAITAFFLVFRGWEGRIYLLSFFLQASGERPRRMNRQGSLYWKQPRDHCWPDAQAWMKTWIQNHVTNSSISYILSVGGAANKRSALKYELFIKISARSQGAVIFICDNRLRQRAQKSLSWKNPILKTLVHTAKKQAQKRDLIEIPLIICGWTL